MAQFLKVTVGNSVYLLPGKASLGIVQKDKLMLNGAGGNIVGWKQDASGRWPAYALTEDWAVDSSASWERAVFIPGSPSPIGIGANTVEMMTNVDIEPQQFTPAGPAPSRFGHLFNAVWVDDGVTHLVINPPGVAGYLSTVGGSS
ncbi:MAG: hypothetical protein OEZ10_04755 [Gammaproteobacteria bacterium]|nr:hypothetical protein [Gammaproteobacteria bacterium]